MANSEDQPLQFARGSPRAGTRPTVSSPTKPVASSLPAATLPRRSMQVRSTRQSSPSLSLQQLIFGRDRHGLPRGSKEKTRAEVPRHGIRELALWRSIASGARL